MAGAEERKLTLCARLPGLVDLVALDGQPAYLVLEDGKLEILKRVESPGGGQAGKSPGKQDSAD